MLGYSGGDVTVARSASDMANLLSSLWDFGFVTSLVNFYGFRDKGNATPDELQQRIDEAVNQKMGRDWSQSRLFSYVQQYEFESLLFSDFRGFAGLPDISDNSITALREIRTDSRRPKTSMTARQRPPANELHRRYLSISSTFMGHCWLSKSGWIPSAPSAPVSTLGWPAWSHWLTLPTRYSGPHRSH